MNHRIVLPALIDKATSGDIAAFTELTRRYQNMAFGCALSILGDYHAAQDAVQETFVSAFLGLAKVRNPDAFPSWLRAVTKHQCHRILRKRHLETLPIDHAIEIPINTCDPNEELEKREMLECVLRAIANLPQDQREAITLFYLHEHSQREIAAFLDLPIGTVNNRVHAARKNLKKKMLTMLSNSIKSIALSDVFANNVGKVIRVQGPVIDAQFNPTDLPEILTALTVTDDWRQTAVTVQMAQSLENGVVRCVAINSVGKLRKGMKILSKNQPLRSPISNEVARHAIAGIGNKSVRPGGRKAKHATGSKQLLETGIKVIDLMCPLVKGGKVGIFGEMRIGKLVLVEEIVGRLTKNEPGATIFTFVSAPEIQLVQELANVKASTAGESKGFVQTVYILSENVRRPKSFDSSGLDTIIYLDSKLSNAGLYPAINPLLSRGANERVVGIKHYRVATRVRDILRRAETIERIGSSAGVTMDDLSKDDRVTLERAMKLRFFFTQPFFVAERYTGTPGEHVSRAHTIQASDAITRGEYDHLLAGSLRFIGGIQVVKMTGSHHKE